MFKDEFKSRYTTIPFATFARNHKKHTTEENNTSLSHKHKEIEILVVHEGRASFYIDTQNFEIQKGDIVIIPPYALHNATIYKDYDFSHYCICFDTELIPDADLCRKLEKNITTPNYIIKSDHQSSQILYDCICKAYDAHNNGSPGWELKVKGNLSVFFGILIENDCFIKTPDSNNTKDILYRISDYIENNYSKNISSETIADALFMSKSYFCRIFKKNFGYRFCEYICMYRLEKAKILLKTTDMPISDICINTGFNSFSYFSKMFRLHKNMTPSQYRNS